MVLLEQQFVDLMSSLYREGFQFVRLQKLEDESNPDFVVEIVSLFFEDSEQIINNLATALQQKVVNFKQVDAHVHQFKGSSSSLGAHRVNNVCEMFRIYCQQNNIQGCLNCLQHIKHEYILLKNKFEILFRLEQEILAAGGTIPMVA